MTPTPAVETARSLTGLWWIVGLIGVILLLLVIGVLTGEVDLSGKRVRQARNRALLTTQSILEADRRDAIEYVLEEQDQVMLEQGAGADGPGKRGASSGLDKQTNDFD